MSTGKQLMGLLLLSSALVFPSAAYAQSTDEPAETGADSTADEAPAEEEEYSEPDVSIPGGDIVVTGRRMRDVTRSSTQVISVLTNEEIARTGEGDISGALGRVTGLSVQGNGFVYVRGLGDRYSLALLNGLPLDKVSISMTINAPAAILLAMVIAVGKKQGVPPNQLRGTVQNDILKEYIARGTYIFPPQPSMRLITAATSPAVSMTLTSQPLSLATPSKAST